MKILYDYQIFTEQNYGGISRYFTEIISRIGVIDKNTYEISLLFSNNCYLKNKKLNKKEFFHKIEFKGKRRLIKQINKYYSRKILKKNDFDIFHPTYYDPYFINEIKKPYVITVHDLIYFIFPNQNKHELKIRANIQNVVRNASHVIAISKNTKCDIIKYLNIDEKKISVIYHSCSLNVELLKNHKSKLSINYFLYVGNRRGYKNFSNLILAIAEILIIKNLFLICAGGTIPSREEIALLEKLNVKDKVLFFPQINDDYLTQLYTNALCFIYPSKYEGFGIPILESFACGCPVLLSNTSSFPEIAGDAAIYFNPNSIESIRDAVMNYLELSIEEKNEMRSKGFDRLKLFSWDKAYEQTISVYEKLV